MTDSKVFEALQHSRLFREVRQALCQTTGLALTLVGPDAQPRWRAPVQEGNPFCALMGKHTVACAACLEVHREFQRRFKRKLAPQQVCCFAGLSELAVPVVVAGQHVATLVGGQAFLQKPSRRHFEVLARRLRQRGMRANLRQVERAYFRVPVMPARQFQGAVRLLTILANQLAESAGRLVLGANGGESVSGARAKEFALAHAGGAVTLKHAAEYAHLSRHYFCKTFKRATGMTFTKFVARVRVEKAKGLLHEPALRMNEVADRAGFQSISQFNRVFRQLTGRSPTRFRAVAC